jgi:hypothetical protein
MDRFPQIVDENWIGVHYRATDMIGRPYDEKELRRFAARRPVLVCSDSAVIEAKAAALPNVHTLRKPEYVEKQDASRAWTEGWNVNRSRQSVVGAVADLYLLAKAGRLVGSKRSSFFTIAKVFAQQRGAGGTAPIKRAKQAVKSAFAAIGLQDLLRAVARHA